MEIERSVNTVFRVSVGTDERKETWGDRIDRYLRQIRWKFYIGLRWMKSRKRNDVTRFRDSKDMIHKMLSKD